MNLTFRGLVFALSVAVGVGCSSTSVTTNTYPAPKVIDGGANGPMGTGGTGVTLPAPMSGEGNVLLFKGPAQMLGHGSPCTNEIGATADRWCAFISPSTSSLGRIDLFVINVSRAAAGVAISCAGGIVDPNCLKLTGGFFEEPSTPFPHAAGFQGDTLIYFDSTGAGYGWRPGMANGRVLVADGTGSVHDCVPSVKGTSVLCQKTLDPQPIDGLTQNDLMVGKLDAATDPPLTRVDTVISNDGSLQASQQHFRVGFSPDGEYVAWSSAATQGGVEILKTQKVGDDRTRVTVATDVSRWSFSPDGTHWYWLSKFNYDIAGMRSGILQTAPFADGSAATTLLPSVGEFTVARSGAIVARAMVSMAHGDLKGIPDPIGAPAIINTLDTGVVGFLSVGPKGHVAYTKNVDSLFQVVDLYVKKLDGTGAACSLTTQANGQRSLFFLPGGGGVVWAQITNLDTASVSDPFIVRESFTRLSDCTTVAVATNIGSYGIAGDDSVLIEDEFDGVEGTLRIRKVNAGETLGDGPSVLLQTRVNDYVPLTPAPGVVLFTVSADSLSDGLYLHPLGAAAPAGSDAGIASPDGGSGSAPDAGQPDGV